MHHLPAEPQQHGAKNNEDGAVSRHLDWLPVAVKAADTRSCHDCCNQAGETPDHVDDGTTGKINHAGAKQVILTSSE